MFLDGKCSELFCFCHQKVDLCHVSQVDVNGPTAHPIYKHLTQKKPPAVEWNFTKFLVDKRGQIVEKFDHKSSFSLIENAIRGLL